jgi:lysophospholipase L1-like esterase
MLGVLTLVLVAAIGGSSHSRRAEADAPVVGYPNSIASLGDSITRAFDADPSMFGEQLENSWSTGTSPSVNSIYSRLLAVYPPISGNRFNDAVSGAKMVDLNGQASNAVGQGASLVLVLMGGNDVCTPSEGTMTPVATFQTQFQQAMQTLSRGLPDARIAVGSVPDVYNLWSILHDNANAQNVWQGFNICQSLLANPTSMAPADVQRRADVRQRNMDFNTVLHDVCAQYAHCRFDNYVGFNTAFTTDDVSTLDYFHPSLAGQAHIASLAWANFYDFTDTTPPVSNSSASAISGGVSVLLTATDAAGISGIEYRIGSAGYQTYSGPFSVPLGSSFTWRAVDVNGNTEGTHTCRSGGWAWPTGDSDCDGFADTVAAGGRAPESFIGTDPTRACASTPTANDEPLPDAWPMDFNDDQLVGLADVSRYSSVFGSHSPGPPYDARFDLNGDGVISLPDVAMFSQFFGKRCA